MTLFKKTYFLLLFLCCTVHLNAQFEFKGEVNTAFTNATAYLNVVDDFNKRDHFFTENIIQESKIDISGNFVFTGNLAENNKLYKIYIDNCNDDITDSKHLLNHCEENVSILFIANNTDKIFFPLNDLSQMFCDFQFSKPQNIAINKIDVLQETLLNDLQRTKNDVQRQQIYKSCFTELQKFSKSLDEPLAELYAYHLYSDKESFSRDFYLEDLKKSNYYNELLVRLDEKYPNSNYVKRFKNELITADYSYLKDRNNSSKYVLILLSFGLLISLLANFLMFAKNKKLKNNPETKQINYKDVLTNQEQKVFELMNQSISNKEIADKLFISLSTVKTHINNIYSKLKITSRKEISAYF